MPSIHCSSCEDYLRSALSELPHLRDLTIDSLQHSLTFVLDSAHEQGPAREGLVKAVQRVLDAAGYPSYRTQTDGGVDFLRRARNRFGFWKTETGKNEKRHKRHLEHCEACQVEQDQNPGRAEKGEGTSLDAVRVDSASGKDVYRTQLAIEGMTCRYASSSSSHFEFSDHTHLILNA